VQTSIILKISSNISLNFSQAFNMLMDFPIITN